MARTITVQAGPDLKPGEVALWEVHDDHPDGEVMIAKAHPGEQERSHKVARTPAVNARLSDGRLVQPGRRSQDDDEDEETMAEPAPPAQATGRRGVAGG